MTTRAVFLDRDGVINNAHVVDGRPYPPRSVAELKVASGVADGLTRLRAAGFRLIVVSNQPDVARGLTTRAAIEAIHAALCAQLPLDEIRVCYHDDADYCMCRKPLPGLLLDAARSGGIDLQSSFMIGDRWRDVQAGRAAGCRTVLLNRCYDEPIGAVPDALVTTFDEAVTWILSGRCATNERLGSLKVKIFADGADLPGMMEVGRLPYIKGFTTNPTLMRKAGVTNYEAFAREVLRAIPDRPISFEVFSDDPFGMERQAREIALWGDNVYVKIPITNTRREKMCALAGRLSHDGVKVNITAVLTLAQVRDVVEKVAGGAPCCISVFAGRIADTGCDPLPMMTAALELLHLAPNAELIWASPRELLNVIQADEIGCHIITVTNDILKKLQLVGRDLDDYSLETVRMFYDDAVAAGLTLGV